MRKIIICTVTQVPNIKCKSLGIRFLEMPSGRKYSIETVLSANYLLQPLVF